LLSRYSHGLRTGRPGFDSWQGQCFFKFTASGPALGLIQPLSKLVPRAVSPKVKRPDREAGYSHQLPRSRIVELYLHCTIIFMGSCTFFFLLWGGSGQRHAPATLSRGMHSVGRGIYVRYPPPTLIVLLVDLVHHFINTTRLTVCNCSLVTYH
jgi:hypothetical protein